MATNILGYAAQGVTFSSTGYATKSGALTSVSDSGSGVVSFWVNNTAVAGAFRNILVLVSTTPTDYLKLYLGSTAKATILAENSGGTTVLSANTNTAFSSMTTTWKHVVMSWNLAATPVVQIYTNGVSDATVTTDILASQTIHYSANGTQYLGADSGGINTYGANIADLQVWFGTHVDLSVAANLALFISGGAPVNPAVAKAALGTPTIIQSGAASSWQTNGGSAGGFTIATGTITTGATSPPLANSSFSVASAIGLGTPALAINLPASTNLAASSPTLVATPAFANIGFVCTAASFAAPSPVIGTPTAGYNLTATLFAAPSPVFGAATVTKIAKRLDYCGRLAGVRRSSDRPGAGCDIIDNRFADAWRAQCYLRGSDCTGAGVASVWHRDWRLCSNWR